MFSCLPLFIGGHMPRVGKDITLEPSLDEEDYLADEEEKDEDFYGDQEDIDIHFNGKYRY